MRRLDHHQDNYGDIPLALPIYPELDENHSSGMSVELPLSSGTNRQSGKSSRATASVSTSIGKGSSSSSSWSSKGGTSGRKKKTHSSKSRSTTAKKGIPTVLNTLHQKASSNTAASETIVGQIKKEDTSNTNWNCPTEDDSKKVYYDLYEHSYDLIAPPPPPLDDLGMNSIAIHESQGEPLS